MKLHWFVYIVTISMMASSNLPPLDDDEYEDDQNGLSEEQMIDKLLKSGKYEIHKKGIKGEIDDHPEHHSTPKEKLFAYMKGLKGQGAIPKFGRGRGLNLDDSPLKSKSIGLQSHLDDELPMLKTTPPVPKVGQFSGDTPPQKGDVSYEEWRFEIRCLQNDSEVSASQLVQCIRRSLRGTARKMLIPLGDKASVGDILHKLDALFSDISTNGMVMQEFFNSFQKSDENVTSFGCRLESLLQTAIDHGYLGKESKDDLLRHKFWTSLRCEKLKSQTRHKYDTISSYDELLRELRQVEKEISISKHSVEVEHDGSSARGKHSGGKNVHQQAITTDADRIAGLEKKLDSKMQSLESRMTTLIDSKFSTILQKLDGRGQGDSGFYNNARGQGHFGSYDTRGQGHSGSYNDTRGQGDSSNFQPPYRGGSQGFRGRGRFPHRGRANRGGRGPGRGSYDANRGQSERDQGSKE